MASHLMRWMYVALLTQPSSVCQLVYVTGVTASSNTSQPEAYPLLSNTESWPVLTVKEAQSAAQALVPQQGTLPGRVGAYELPTCPVCLERLDANVSGLVTGICQHAFHCACLQRWEDSRCPVCRYSQSLGAVCDEAQPTPRQSTGCQLCGTTSDTWVCLICANVGCGRYQEGHAAQHFAETGHFYSLELETHRVWDYAGDGYVHRLIQSKTDGKLVELPSEPSSLASDRLWNANYPGAAHARRHTSGKCTRTEESADDKMHTLGLEYANMIVSQLDSQRMYYEGLLSMAHAQRTAQPEMPTDESTSLPAQLQEANATCAQLQAELEESRAQSDRYANQLRRALDSLRTLKKEHAEEKSVSDGLYHHVQKLQAEQQTMQTRINELTEELRDVMFFVTARDKIEDTDKALPADHALHGGSVVVPEPAPERKKGKRRGKG